MSLHSVLACTVSDEKSAIICIFVALHVMDHFILVGLKIFLLLIFNKLIMLCLGMPLKTLFCLEFDEFLDLWFYGFEQIWKDFSHFSCIFFCLHSSALWDSRAMQDLALSYTSLRLRHFLSRCALFWIGSYCYVSKLTDLFFLISNLLISLVYFLFLRVYFSSVDVRCRFYLSIIVV